MNIGEQARAATLRHKLNHDEALSKVVERLTPIYMILAKQFLPDIETYIRMTASQGNDYIVYRKFDTVDWLDSGEVCWPVMVEVLSTLLPDCAVKRESGKLHISWKLNDRD